jgi:hypothetical protein
MTKIIIQTDTGNASFELKGDFQLPKEMIKKGNQIVIETPSGKPLRITF